MEIQVSTTTSFDLLSFLASKDFEVEVLTEHVFKVTREGELPVFLSHNDGSLYFEVDIGNADKVAAVKGGHANVWRHILDMNTDILPVSFGINSTNPGDPRLVLVESRVTGDLNDEEVLSVFTALELAADKVERFLS